MNPILIRSWFLPRPASPGHESIVVAPLRIRIRTPGVGPGPGESGRREPVSALGSASGTSLHHRAAGRGIRRQRGTCHAPTETPKTTRGLVLDVFMSKVLQYPHVALQPRQSTRSPETIGRVIHQEYHMHSPSLLCCKAATGCPSRLAVARTSSERGPDPEQGSAEDDAGSACAIPRM